MRAADRYARDAERVGGGDLQQVRQFRQPGGDSAVGDRLPGVGRTGRGGGSGPTAVRFRTSRGPVRGPAGPGEPWRGRRPWWLPGGNSRLAGDAGAGRRGARGGRRPAGGPAGGPADQRGGRQSRRPRLAGRGWHVRGFIEGGSARVGPRFRFRRDGGFGVRRARRRPPGRPGSRVPASEPAPVGAEPGGPGRPAPRQTSPPVERVPVERVGPAPAERPRRRCPACRRRSRRRGGRRSR